MVQQKSVDDSLARAISNLSVSEGPDGDREPAIYSQPSPVTDGSGDPNRVYYINPPPPGAVGRRWVVWRGLQPGIYDNWPAANAQVEGVPCATHQRFGTPRLAWEAYEARRVENRVNRLPYIPPDNDVNITPPRRRSRYPLSMPSTPTQDHVLSIGPPRSATSTRFLNRNPSPVRSKHFTLPSAQPSTRNSCVAASIAHSSNQSGSPCLDHTRHPPKPQPRTLMGGSNHRRLIPGFTSPKPHAAAYPSTRHSVQTFTAGDTSSGSITLSALTIGADRTPGQSVAAEDISSLSPTPLASSEGADAVSVSVSVSPSPAVPVTYVKVIRQFGSAINLPFRRITSEDDPWEGEAEAYVVFKGTVPGVYRTWEDCKNLTRDCIGPVYCGYGQWSDGVLAYTKALREGRTQVLPVVLMESDSWV